LWIFGNNVEDRVRGFRFARFYLGTGVIATVAFVVMNPSATVPLIGASGAIAGVMGAYLILFPRATVTAIVPPFFFFPFRVPAMLFLVIWFATQFLISDTAGDVAWEAHVGGFIAGVAYALLRSRPRRR
jgi:membrane associated rhomboid family serine protease